MTEKLEKGNEKRGVLGWIVFVVKLIAKGVIALVLLWALTQVGMTVVSMFEKMRFWSVSEEISVMKSSMTSSEKNIALRGLIPEIKTFSAPDGDGSAEDMPEQKVELTEQEKGAMLLNAMTRQIRWEIENSALGWSINDAPFMVSKYFDNRANRQRGVIFAYRMFYPFYSTQLSKHGKDGTENEFLKKGRRVNLVYGTDTWGWFRPSFEAEMRDLFEFIDEYQKGLLAGEAGFVFNMRSDDKYNLLKFIVSDEFLDEVKGLVNKPNSEVGHFELDDHMYYAQGVALVVRDVLWALVSLYPDITAKGGAENIKTAFEYLNLACSLSPALVTRGKHNDMMPDYRNRIYVYLNNVDVRVTDVMESLNR